MSQAEEQFKACWSKLVILLYRGDQKQLLDAITTFQPTLAKALYRLESVYQKLCQEGRDLVARRKTLTRRGLRQRLHTINGFKHLLKQTSDVGKALGDGFAWFFYQNERELVRRHLEQQSNPHPPTGIGGLGEVEFVTRIPKLGDYFVLGHSTTTFLRLGDVSLIDLATFRVAAIGELKTHESGNSRICVSINLVGRKGTTPPQLPIPVAAAGPSAPPPKPLPPALQQRLVRQISRIKDSFKPKPSDGELGYLKSSGYSLHDKLAELHNHCSVKGCAYVHADRGLLLIGFPRTGQTLYPRLTANIPGKATFKRLRIDEAAKALVDKSLPDNSLRIDWVHYRARQRYELERDMPPLAWWPLPSSVIEALLFKKLAVMTLYNPAFLLARLRSAGLQVTSTREGAITIEKQSKEKRLKIEGIPYFLRLVQCYLLSDTTLSTLITQMASTLESADLGRPGTVHWNLDFLFS